MDKGNKKYVLISLMNAEFQINVTAAKKNQSLDTSRSS